MAPVHMTMLRRVGNEVSYDFTVKHEGSCDLYALVDAPSSDDNSFWGSVAGGEWVEWHLTVASGWQWQRLSNGSSQDPVTLDLQPEWRLNQVSP